MVNKTDTISSCTDNAELVKAGAAGLAKSTAGRSRVIDSKKVYKRAKINKETKEIVNDPTN